jgi:hypothetical protein
MEEAPSGQASRSSATGEAKSCWGFLYPNLQSVQNLVQVLDPAETNNEEVKRYKQMFPPRFFTQGKTDLYKETLGGDVQLCRLTAEAVQYVVNAGAIHLKVQQPPSYMRLHPGHMHLVLNLGAQIKFAAEVLLDQDTAISAAYHALFGSPYFSEVNPEDYTNMYVKIEQFFKDRIYGRNPKPVWLSC